MARPLVSLVMPTFNRAKFIPTALRCFYQQTYPNLELIVVDDGEESFPLPPDSRIRRVTPIQKRASTGAKRNQGVAIARGEIIANWDDDDWSSPHRIEDQVQRLLKSGKSVTGYSDTIRVDEKGSLWTSEPSIPFPASGTSQTFFKSYWLRHRYPNISMGEDSEFSRVAREENQLTTVKVGWMMLCRLHATNTSLTETQNMNRISPSCVDPEGLIALSAPHFDEEYIHAPHVCTPLCAAHALVQSNAPELVHMCHDACLVHHPPPKLVRPTYAIRGHAAPHVRVVCGGQTITADDQGDFVFADLEDGEHRVTPLDPNWIFTPKFATLSLRGKDEYVGFAAQTLAAKRARGRGDAPKHQTSFLLQPRRNL
jgi:hypothetical protein